MSPQTIILRARRPRRIAVVEMICRDTSASENWPQDDNVGDVDPALA